MSALAFMCGRRHSRGRQRGQSTTEFVVLALVMVPLLLTVPLLGKYMDIAQTTALASRYVAFEGTIRHSSSMGGWKSDAELAQEVRRRFFSNSDAPIKTNDSAGDFTAHRNTLWFDHRGDPLLPTFASSVGATTDRASMGSPNAWFAGHFGLSHTNLYSGRVGASVANVAGLKPFDALNLTISRTTTVLVDPWAASGPGAVRRAIRNSPNDPLGPFPYGLLETEVAAMDLLTSGLPWPFREAMPDAGRVDPDRVPADRLGP